MAEKLLDLGGAEIARVALAEMENETPRPVDVGILGADGVMFSPNDRPDLVEKPGSMRVSRKARSVGSDNGP
jgi:hypothetical protein